MQAKHLHDHAVPIVVLSVGLFLASVLGVSQLLISVGPTSDNSLIHLFSERLFTIHPTANGLFKVGRYESGARGGIGIIPRISAPNPNNGLNAVSSLGEVANLTVTLDSLNDQSAVAP
jgi:hypothetical protein